MKIALTKANHNERSNQNTIPRECCIEIAFWLLCSLHSGWFVQKHLVASAAGFFCGSTIQSGAFKGKCGHASKAPPSDTYPFNPTGSPDVGVANPLSITRRTSGTVLENLDEGLMPDCFARGLTKAYTKPSARG